MAEDDAPWTLSGPFMDLSGSALKMQTSSLGIGGMGGSDYPHAIGSIPLMMKALRAINVPETDRAAILGGNAARLYKLPG